MRRRQWCERAVSTLSTLLLGAVFFACAHAPSSPPEKASAPAPRTGEFVAQRFAGGALSVEMPPPNNRSVKTRTIPQGEMKVDIAEAMPRGTGDLYVASYADLPADLAQRADPKALLDGVQQSTLRQLGMDLVSSRDITVDGMPGREIVGRKGKEGGALVRVLLGNDGVLSLIGTYTAAQPPPEIVRFVSSAARTTGVASSASPAAPQAAPPAQPSK